MSWVVVEEEEELVFRYPSYLPLAHVDSGAIFWAAQEVGV